jgi:hypothetical protein
MLPETVYVKARDVMDHYGLRRKCFRKMVDAGALRPLVFPGTKRPHFKRAEVVRVLGEA